MDPGERKRRLRETMEARRRAVPAAEAVRAGEAVARHLAAWGAWARAERIGLYAALPGELPTDSLVRAALAEGKALLWPRVTAGGELEFAPCEEPEALVAGRHGVRVPPASRGPVRLGPEDLLVVPGLAFDAAGGRLGRGGGHYDRAFPPDAGDAPRLVGAGYAFQIVEAVPREAHDRALDGLVTEEGLLRSARRRPNPGACTNPRDPRR